MEPWMLILVVPVAFVAFSYLRGYRSPKQLARIGEAIEGGARVVDVRTPAEFQSGHHRGATNVPLYELRAAAPGFGSLDRPVVLYCRSGSRSRAARRILETSGFTNVLDAGPLRNTQNLPPARSPGEGSPSQARSKNKRKRSRKRRP